MPRGAIQPMKARSPFVRSVLSVDANAAMGLATRTRTATRASVGSSRCRSDCGVTVAEMEMNRTPMISCTSVSKNGRRDGMSKPRRLARASPMKIAAMSPVSSRITSHAAATAITAASCAVVPSTSPSRSLRSSSQSSAVPITPPARPTPTLAANCPSWLPGPLRVLATTPWNTSAPRIPPTGSISDPSQMRTCCTRSVGRTKLSSGPTTVGPETTRMMPSITAAPRDMPRSGAATEAASTLVISTPSTIRRITTLRVWPLSLRISRLRPAS